MKKFVVLAGLSLMLTIGNTAIGQSEEVQQLLLNVEKLAQLKEILNGLYKSYEVLHNGYSVIKDVSKGNFSLHKDFLDKLLQVSPVVKNYKRIPDIIGYQIDIVHEYKTTFNRFSKDRNFDVKELQYFSKVYTNLVKESLKNLEALVNVVTANKLGMSDDERLGAIDKLFDDMQEKLSFLRYFNKSNTLLALQRARDKNDLKTIRQVYGLTQ